MISNEEFLLLYDKYSSKNPEFATSGFNPRARVLKSVTAAQEHLDMAVAFMLQKKLRLAAVVPRTSGA